MNVCTTNTLNQIPFFVYVFTAHYLQYLPEDKPMHQAYDGYFNIQDIEVNVKVFNFGEIFY